MQRYSLSTQAKVTPDSYLQVLDNVLTLSQCLLEFLIDGFFFQKYFISNRERAKEERKEKKKTKKERIIKVKENSKRMGNLK